MTKPAVPHRAATIGQLLRRARFTVGFTQDDLATATGILRTTISKYEHGKRLPSIDEIYAIADACACPISDLLPGADATSSPELRTIMQILIDHPDIIPTVLHSLHGHIGSAPARLRTGT